jgi:site-specific DNA-cytosine methylase
MAGIFNAADFGVPQTRRRVFLIGLKGRPNADAFGVFDTIYNSATHRDPARPHMSRERWVTLRDVLINRKDPGGWKHWVETPLTVDHV